ncbi:hypothetical protein C1752_17616 [Acaryochloris thomasi RCC1774]|uniref:Uncharacterized protein n=1 Tax=Acaryochloris thomasi RCC1774 TaxID=1764569 RepID=A0A2W1JEI0_9CYAN|nr:hypothetical protein [Acaryochloris thomasi]PZD70155.1 hypothetical protein C1752_17616 [Acaryochloris thomasi RCC1774]
MNLLSKLFNRNRLKVDGIVRRETQSAKIEDHSSTGRRIQGSIVPEGDQTYFRTSNGDDYITFDAYGQWPGMVCEAAVEWVDSPLDKSVKGHASEIFVRNIVNGRFYKLPSPEQIESFPKDRACSCPFCIVDYFEGH